MKKNIKRTPHIQYRNSDNKQIPGVTTILGILNKPGLMDWASNMGKAGLNWREELSNAGDRGTLAHTLIEDYLNKEPTDTSDYTTTEMKNAFVCVTHFMDWLKDNPIKEIILMEKPLVSNKYGYGGTPDFYVVTDCRELIDIKTGKTPKPRVTKKGKVTLVSGIYESFEYQAVAYKPLITENGYPEPERIKIVKLPIEPEGIYEEKIIEDIDTNFLIFLNCLNIYKLRKSN